MRRKTFYLLFFTMYAASCAKIEHKVIHEPAYLRVFNNLNFRVTIDNQHQTLSTLTMLINPEYGADGLPISAETVGDFLVTREPYAPPYPSHIGNALDVYNPEYPGKERVIAGPILNGFDLSSWAQIPSGQMRIAFYARPRSEVPFFELEARYRAALLIDTVLNLQAKEVYTMHVLQKDFNTKENGILLRQENFHKLALADSLLYINFYNMSAKGFWEASDGLKPANRNHFLGISGSANFFGIRDEMNVYYSLYDHRTTRPDPIAAHTNVFLTHLMRDTESPAVARYHPLPLFAGSHADAIQSFLLQSISLLAPQYDGTDIPNQSAQLYFTPYSYAHIVFSRHTGASNRDIPWNGWGSSLINNGIALPNLIVQTHSGVNNPRSFSTVNSLEVVNETVYLTTVQRVYDPPIY
ncbi:hypothetical protein ACFOET_03605 [Parapedobacter deserti]|uniref:DUF4270 family protein n=1 Tax=Parapedobacter deserti TaxID=1912957 RepID=A0ABV7JIV6_9SPHI